MTYNTLKNRVKRLSSVSSRPMFGYECYSAKGKFFVGFSNKNDYEIIVRITKEEQQKLSRIRIRE